MSTQFTFKPFPNMYAAIEAVKEALEAHQIKLDGQENPVAGQWEYTFTQGDNVLGSLVAKNMDGVGVLTFDSSHSMRPLIEKHVADFARHLGGIEQQAVSASRA
jgi:hypothetical protein